MNSTLSKHAHKCGIYLLDIYLHGELLFRQIRQRWSKCQVGLRHMHFQFLVYIINVDTFKQENTLHIYYIATNYHGSNDILNYYYLFIFIIFFFLHIKWTMTQSQLGF